MSWSLNSLQPHVCLSITLPSAIAFHCHYHHSCIIISTYAFWAFNIFLLWVINYHAIPSLHRVLPFLFIIWVLCNPLHCLYPCVLIHSLSNSTSMDHSLKIDSCCGPVVLSFPRPPFLGLGSCHWRLATGFPIGPSPKSLAVFISVCRSGPVQFWDLKMMQLQPQLVAW